MTMSLYYSLCTAGFCYNHNPQNTFNQVWNIFGYLKFPSKIFTPLSQRVEEKKWPSLDENVFQGWTGRSWPTSWFRVPILIPPTPRHSEGNFGCQGLCPISLTIMELAGGRQVIIFHSVIGKTDEIDVTDKISADKIFGAKSKFRQFFPTKFFHRFLISPYNSQEKYILTWDLY